MAFPDKFPAVVLPVSNQMPIFMDVIFRKEASDRRMLMEEDYL